MLGVTFFGREDAVPGGIIFDVTGVVTSFVVATVEMVLGTEDDTAFCKVMGEVFRCVAGFIIILPAPKKRANVIRNKKYKCSY